MALDFAWKSYSSKPVTEKRAKTNKDGSIKLDKNGNVQYGTHINGRALAQNILGNGMNWTYSVTNLIPDKQDAENAGNSFAKDFRNKADDVLMQSNILPLMGVALTDKVLGKMGWGTTGTDSSELKTVANIGNTALGSTPIVGAIAGKLFGTSTAKKFSTDLLSQSQTFNRTLADGLYGASGIVFQGQKAKDLVDLENIRNWIGDSQLQSAQKDFLAAKDSKYAKEAERQLSGMDMTLNFGPVSGKNGTTLQFTKRTLSRRKIKKHQTGGQVNNSNLPQWLFYDADNNEYVSDFYDTSSKEDIQALKDYVKKYLPKWRVWQSPVAQKRYFVLTEEEANKRNWKLANSFNNSGSSGGQIHDGNTVEIDGKTLYQLLEPNSESTHTDGNGNFYYYPEHLKFKEGGKVNVIPSGALHAHKHNLTEKAEDGEKFEDVTTKGIPVVVEDEKGNLIQQAEIEREEIIFRLEVTKELEELAKEGTDEAAIKAGKLLVEEILYNTKDNTKEMI